MSFCSQCSGAGRVAAACWRLAIAALAFGLPGGRAAGLDQNGNQISDVWERLFNVPGITAAGDVDGDGVSNLAESIAGTDPRAAQSVLALAVQTLVSGEVEVSWDGLVGKQYQLMTAPDLGNDRWETNIVRPEASGRITWHLAATGSSRFVRLAVGDLDRDLDQVSDWEEQQLGLNPATANTGREMQSDLVRAGALLAATNVVTISALDPEMAERWPDPGLIVVRRVGGWQPLTIGFAVTGTAERGVDYTMPEGNSIHLPPGAHEVWVELHPIADAADEEPTETITFTLLPGSGYRLGSNAVATVNLVNETAEGPPNAKAAARFLLQSAFGPDADSLADDDLIPENVEDVMTRGFAGWIEHQFSLPVGRLQPFVEWAERQNQLHPDYNDPENVGGELKQAAWWNRVLGAAKLRPDAPTNAPDDVLRQRVAWALSQIFVVSDRTDDLTAESLGFANFYDLLLQHAFGNFRDLLHGVTVHPVMGLYLSHLGNRRPDPIHRIYPDENYAREIMQLFTIGLWELHPDGTRQVDALGQFIPTYDNRTITGFARVFTGMAMGGSNVNFGTYPRAFTSPMGTWDEYHDLNPKTLLRGVTLPARTASPGTNGLATRADVGAAVDNLFQHPNVGPFIGRLLIQRLVTSNPSTGYVARVAAAFANDGGGVRGDLKAVIRGILLDREARDPVLLADPAFGKLREPLLRCVALGRAFHAQAGVGWYPLDTFYMDHVQEPFKSPSVFNFYLPTYSPPGPLTQLGLVAPEFQIVNASSAVSAANYFWNAIWDGMHRWGYARADHKVALDLSAEMALTAPAAAWSDHWLNVEPYDLDPLLRRLDLVLTGGTLSPAQLQVIREHVDRVRWPTWDWPRERLRLAIYLILNTPEFCVQR